MIEESNEYRQTKNNVNGELRSPYLINICILLKKSKIERQTLYGGVGVDGMYIVHVPCNVTALQYPPVHGKSSYNNCLSALNLWEK